MPAAMSTKTAPMLNLLDLFSGIGGFSLGLERTGGFRTVAFCEIESFCRSVLQRHWPNVPCYDDVCALTAERLAADGITVDAICGGFPCQDISVAGKGAGIEGERSGLWSEYARLIGELRPRYVIVENVAAIRGRGLDRVLCDLAAVGYDAEWHCISAAAVGAPHRRDRFWLVAYPSRDHGTEQTQSGAFGQRAWSRGSEGAVLTNAAMERRPAEGGGVAPRYADRIRELRQSGTPHWIAEPDVGRLVDGVLTKVERARLRALGNAVVPQIPEIIGNAILGAE